MISKSKFIYFAMLMIGFVITSNVSALNLSDSAWVAQHFVGDSPTDEFYLVIKDEGLNIDVNSVKLKDVVFKSVGTPRDFFQLTGQQDNENVKWLEIDKGSSKVFRDFEIEALKRSNRLARRSLFRGYTDSNERQGWLNHWLETLMFELMFRDEDGNEYRGEIGFATFENPLEASPTSVPKTPTNDIVPVPEPATIILLTTGLIGLAGFNRKKFLKK